MMVAAVANGAGIFCVDTDVEAVWSHTWEEGEIEADLLPVLAGIKQPGFRIQRLTSADQEAIAAAKIADEAMGGKLSEAAQRCGVVVVRNEAAPEAVISYMMCLVKHEKRAGMVNDFAHSSLTSTLHYVANIMGFRGYGTCLFELESGAQLLHAIEDIAATGSVDYVFCIFVNNPGGFGTESEFAKFVEGVEIPRTATATVYAVTARES